jgi:hypothetical protein
MQKDRKLSHLGLALALVAVPGFVAAQTPQQQQQPAQQAAACTIQPSTVQAEGRATPITVTVGQQFGEVTGVTAPAASGITLATASDLPREPLATGQPAPRPIAMGDGANKWVVYLNVAEAEAGRHELTFRSARGQCTAQLTVGGASGAAPGAAPAAPSAPRPN